MRNDSQFETLLAEGKRYWKQGSYSEAAHAYVAAGENASSAKDEANARQNAAALFALAKNEDARSKNIARSIELWGIAARAERTTAGTLDCYWNAFRASVAARDKNAQINNIRTLVEIIEQSYPLQEQTTQLRSYLNKLSAAAARDVQPQRELQHALASVYFEQARAERDRERREGLLEQAKSLFDQAKDGAKRSIVEEELRKHIREDAAKVEDSANQQVGLEDKARLYEQAASIYRRYWIDDAERCLELARDARATAGGFVASLSRLTEVEAELRQALHAIPSVEPLSAKKSRRFSEAGGLLSSRFGELGIFVSEEVIVARDRTFGLGSGPGEAHNAVIEVLAEYLRIDLKDPVNNLLLRRLLAQVGHRNSYCPTPSATPQWIVTTTWRKTVLALVAGAITGTLTGVAAGGPDLHQVLIGALGAESAIVINLLSTYLVTPQEGKQAFASLLEKHRYEPSKALIILELNRRPATVGELCSTVGLSRSKVQRILKELSSEGTVKKRRSGPHDAWLWILSEQ